MNFIAALDKCHEGKVMTAIITAVKSEIKIEDSRLFYRNENTKNEWEDVSGSTIPAHMFIAKWSEVAA